LCRRLPARPQKSEQKRGEVRVVPVAVPLVEDLRWGVIAERRVMQPVIETNATAIDAAQDREGFAREGLDAKVTRS